MSQVLKPTSEAIEDCARRLAQGHLVVIPTETVYGLGADGLNEEAVSRIFSVKGRPADHPVILHVASLQAARGLVKDWPLSADILARAFWPGPMTLVLRRAAHVPSLVTGGQDTVALRLPRHIETEKLLNAFAKIGSGVIAAPSANLFGGVSPTRVQDVVAEIGSRLSQDDRILEGGPCEVGLESTIIDLTGSSPRILRPGGIGQPAIEAVLGRPLTTPSGPDPAIPRVSGSLDAHYAPRTRLCLGSLQEIDSMIRQTLLKQPNARIGCLLLSAASVFSEGEQARVWRASSDPVVYGHELYARLHDLDALGFDLLLFERPPKEQSWDAVEDRLRRAGQAF
jgi:L-threonylcarbamoyladenylate synthase